MKSICALCGRATEPAVMIGQEAIGPKCARRAGLLGSKAPKGGRVRVLGRRPARSDGPQTMDLFAGLDGEQENEERRAG